MTENSKEPGVLGCALGLVGLIVVLYLIGVTVTRSIDYVAIVNIVGVILGVVFGAVAGAGIGAIVPQVSKCYRTKAGIGPLPVSRPGFSAFFTRPSRSTNRKSSSRRSRSTHATAISRRRPGVGPLRSTSMARGSELVVRSAAGSWVVSSLGGGCRDTAARRRCRAAGFAQGTRNRNKGSSGCQKKMNSYKTDTTARHCLVKRLRSVDSQRAETRSNKTSARKKEPGAWWGGTGLQN